MGLSAIILTNKKEKEIQPTINSVHFADEIVFVRDHQGDHPLNGNFAAQRNLGLSRAKEDWVLFVDDDEIVPAELSKEIKETVESSRYEAYYLPRRDIYFGQELKHGETGGTKIIRLAKKNTGKFIRPVHEIWDVRGRVGQLKNPLLHLRSDLVSSFINRIILYGPIDAKTLVSENKPFSWWRLFLNPKGKFIANYILSLGFLDGYLGLFQAYLMSVQSLSVRVFQWQDKSFSK